MTVRKTVSRDEALNAVETLINYIGDDPRREGLMDTPHRVLTAWENTWGAGYHQDDSDIVKLFDSDHKGEASLIVVREISFFSHCEHHLCPFQGEVSIGYISDPDKGIVGLSKLSRIVDLFARRLQVQERLGNQIADFIEERITSLGCGVLIRATHTCMTSRGVRQPHAQAITSALRGALFLDSRARGEFLTLGGWR